MEMELLGSEAEVLVWEPNLCELCLIMSVLSEFKFKGATWGLVHGFVAHVTVVKLNFWLEINGVMSIISEGRDVDW